MPVPFNSPLLGTGISCFRPIIYSSEILSISYLKILCLLSIKTTCHFLFGLKYQLLIYATTCYVSLCPPNGRFGLPSATTADTVSPCDIRSQFLPLSWPWEGHHKTQTKHEPFLMSRMIYYINALKKSTIFGTRLGKAQFYVVSSLRTEHESTQAKSTGSETVKF